MSTEVLDENSLSLFSVSDVQLGIMTSASAGQLENGVLWANTFILPQLSKAAGAKLFSVKYVLSYDDGQKLRDIPFPALVKYSTKLKGEMDGAKEVAYDVELIHIYEASEIYKFFNSLVKPFLSDFQSNNLFPGILLNSGSGVIQQNDAAWSKHVIIPYPSMSNGTIAVNFFSSSNSDDASKIDGFPTPCLVGFVVDSTRSGLNPKKSRVKLNLRNVKLFRVLTHADFLPLYSIDSS